MTSILPAAVLTIVLCLWAESARAQVARTEVHAIQTLTLTDQQFLTGVKDAVPATVGGSLRIPTLGTERLPAVILVHGSGGVGANVDYWSQQLNGIGVATFVLDSFTGRGIRDTLADQSVLGTVAPIVDAYRALTVLSTHFRIDPQRIALMGFSRGGKVALYAGLSRFQKMYAPDGVTFAAYVVFYAPCATRYIEDEILDQKPVRLFHGSADDFVPVAPCRAYVDRLRAVGNDVQLAEYPNAYHVFDNPLLGELVSYPTAQTTRRCSLLEERPGRIINVETRQPFTLADPCVERGPHSGYNATAAAAATQAVTDFLRATFRLN